MDLESKQAIIVLSSRASASPYVDPKRVAGHAVPSGCVPVLAGSSWNLTRGGHGGFGLMTDGVHWLTVCPNGNEVQGVVLFTDQLAYTSLLKFDREIFGSMLSL